MTSKRKNKSQKKSRSRKTRRKVASNTTVDPKVSCQQTSEESGSSIKSQVWYWVAINRDSAATAPLPSARSPKVSPRPEMLIGYSTSLEQVKWAQYLLRGPIADVRNYLKNTVPQLESSGKLKVVRFQKPQRPTMNTVWEY